MNLGEVKLNKCHQSIQSIVKEIYPNYNDLDSVIITKIEKTNICCNLPLTKTTDNNHFNFNFTNFFNSIVDNVHFSDKNEIEKFYFKNNNDTIFNLFMKYTVYEMIILTNKNDEMIGYNKLVARCLKCDKCKCVFGFPFTLMYHSLTKDDFDICIDCYEKNKENLNDQFILDTVFQIHHHYYYPCQKIFRFYFKE